ncbi:2-C-methyl-D-erythritol 2,4-cyclodiphosphate synthase [bacterium]|nr:2-C-methyl-D-erythritol 2,4-cyclodiphosphate synthase [bacterium]
MNPRIGLGWDRHPLRRGLPLVILGVEIPSSVGPEAHSDGDVLAHALADALLGMAGAGDIGTFFPDDQEWTEGMSGVLLLEKARDVISSRGFLVSQIDAQIRLEKPMLSPYLGMIENRCREVLELSEDEVRITARHGEGLGPVGRGEGLEALVMVIGKKRRIS